ncbi:hypothetical protein SDC9_03647 [bioreactor metagenome]|uniref:Glycosyltransferase RgtA/B/C/D-like domain-containing protein n=1 Tax=bioreactor metagenome TaxID=1076179 RepID=A0A644STZ9_9ZZZZ|nr:glycosyltransferase family 39 protein [Methanobrevibacter sp.]MEA4956258.1 glycosyltransferase family 39 protein [Methanobrevibacter sp.]
MKVKKINSITKFFKSNENKLSFLFILLFSSIITILLIWINTSHEILGTSYRDVYFYLIEALRFSGYSIDGYGYINYLSPLIPFLTSLLFDLGFVSETSIFTVTGIFYIIGVLGFFSLLKLRFRNLIAILGSILYAGLSINLLWAANGTIDIPSVSLTIISIYFFVLGIEKNQKYLYLAFPIAVLGFFAKYTAGLAIPLMILYVISKPDIILNIKKYWKNTVLGIILGIITAMPFIAYFLINKIPFGFLNQAQDIASKTTSSTLKVQNDLFFYFTNMPRFIYSINEILAYLLIIIAIVGIIIGAYKSINFLKDSYYESRDNNKSKFEFLNVEISNKLLYMFLCINLLVIILSFLTASKISFIYSELIFFASAFTLSYILNKIIFMVPDGINVKGKDSKRRDSTEIDSKRRDSKRIDSTEIDSKGIDSNNNALKDINTGNIPLKEMSSDYKYDKLSFDLLMFAWFFSYLIFFSAHLVKADRYFTTMAPGFIFFVILALELILNSFNFKNYSLFKKSHFSINNGIIKNLVPIVLIALFLISSFSYLDMNKNDPLVHNEREAVEWIKINNPDYQNLVIWAERGPIFTWYLKQEVFYVNWKYAPNKLSEMMIANKTDYFISISNKTYINGFSPVKKFGDVIIYQRNIQ